MLGRDISAVRGNSRARTRDTRVASLLEGGLILSVATSLALFAFLLRDSGDRVRYAAAESQSMLAGELSRDIQQRIEAVDRLLVSAASAVRLEGIWQLPGNIRSAAIFDGEAYAPGVSAIVVTDRDGKIIASAQDATPPLASLADRDHFRYHKANTDLGLHISGPVIGSLLGQPVMLFSRRLNDERGNFAGIVSGGIFLSYFSDLLGSLNPGEGGVVGLIGFDGKVITRAPFKAEAVGFDMSQTSLFRRLQIAPSGTYTDRAISDGDDRLISYHVVGNLPLVVAFSRSTKVVFADWMHLMSILAAGLAVLCVLKLYAIWMLRRERVRRVHAQQLADVSAAALLAVNRTLEERIEAALVAQEKVHEKLESGHRLEALGQLAGGIAHDMNNVLQTISGASSLIKARQQNPSEVERLATIALGAADRGSSVTRRLLAFARRGNLRAERVELEALLSDVQELLNHTLFGSTVVEVNISPALPSVLIDRMQLETVVVNLVTNARDASPGGGVIAIATQQETIDEARADAVGLPDGTYVRLSIRDHGMGMDSKTLARAIEPFFSTKGIGKGTGLGLSMAKGFAEQSGGKLEIESQVGEGTTVSLWLPMAGEPTPTGQDRKPALVRSRSIGATIAVVDDNQQARELTCEWLGANQFKIHQFASGEAVLAALEDGLEIDLLLTDFSMPGMDGVALTRATRQRVPGMPVIILTGHTGAIAMDMIERAVGDDCVVLQKPIQPGELADRIWIELRRSPAWQSSFTLLATMASAGGWSP